MSYSTYNSSATPVSDLESLISTNYLNETIQSINVNESLSGFNQNSTSNFREILISENSNKESLEVTLLIPDIK